MASNVNRELAAVSPALLPQKLHAYFSHAACQVFDDISDPNSSPEEDAVQQHLVEPLQWLLCAGDPAVVLAGLEEHKVQSNFCGKVFKSGEPAYFCKDCQTDPTCCLCMECFEHSDHKNHRYRLFASGGGGCCDCGDPEAWTSCVYCELHKPTEQNGDEVDPLGVLPSDLVDRAHVFFSSLLWYCMDILCWTETRSLPLEVMQGKTAESLQEESFLTFLYNDEVHSYDEVIYTLTHNIKLTHTEAVNMATYVDRKGRAIIKCGSEDDCLRCRELVNTGLASAEPLKVVVYHATVSAHQSNAILCLSLLKELAEKSVAFRRLISMALVEVSSRAGGCCILDKFFLNDSNMWITARINWQRLVMSSIYMDPLYKKDMAINLTRNYCELQKNFVVDSHHHDICASNMTVQLFTVPSLSRMLVTEHGLLEKILRTLLYLLEPCKDPTSGAFKPRSSTYKHTRMAYIMYDLRYVLRNRPEVWTEELRSQALTAFSLLLDLLGMLQNADPMKRQRGFHVEREEPWEHTFNLSIVLQPAVMLFADWCTSDHSLLLKAVRAAVKKHEMAAHRTKVPFKNHSVDQSLVGKKHLELIHFDILKDYISVHQPLPRLIASLLMGASAQKLSLQQLLQISPTDMRTPLFLMEHCSRVIVMAVQVLAGMWKRNGYSVVNQIMNYQFHFSKEVMFDKDITMLQAMASIMDPDVFMYALIYKFRLEKWLTCPESDPVKRGEGTEDALRFFISEAEEFLFLLIVVFSERYAQGVGEGVAATDGLRREIIHRLYISPLSHSELLKQFRMSENENEIDRLLKEVATLKRAHSAGKSVFELKQSCEKEYNPFFFHYNRMDHSKAEDTHRKKIKAAGGASRVAPAPPEHPPPFCEAFQGVMRLTSCPVLHRVIHCVFKQASSPESKFWSDKLLHETLHLCALMLSEETPADPKSLCNAAIGNFGNNAFLECLENLLTNRRAEEHRTLLMWTVQYLRAARDHGPGTPTTEVSLAPHVEEKEDEPSPDVNASKKREMAKERRDRLMAQMSAMQRRFLEDHREEIEGSDPSATEEVDTGSGADKTPPTCSGVGVSSMMGHAPSPMEVTCILCQEETKDFSSQERTFVQAVHVQRSCVLRKCPPVDTNRDLDFLSARVDLPRGTYTSGCGHHMHADCWRSFLDSKQQEHGRRHFFPLPGQSVQWHTGEFLCPLCQCYSNTVLPLLPRLKCPPEAQPPSRDISLSEWREVVRMAVELGENVVEEEGAMDQGSSVDPTFLDRLRDLFPTYRKPTCYYKQGDSSGDKQLGNVTDLFSQTVFMRAYGADPDSTSERVCVTEWNNCAYTIASLEVNARSQDKFLLGNLSSRQMDNLRSLVRLGGEGNIRPRIKILAKYAQDLINSFLLETPPFTELPNILEVDTFAMLVNLHFTLLSLFASLSSATGSLDDSPVIPSLLGLTDQYLVRIVTAAHVLQFLLTSPPAMEVDSTSSGDQTDSSTELAAGQALQQLWARFRKVAGLPVDTPPNPCELYSGLKEHLCPFLHCATLFFHCLSGVEFVNSSGSASLVAQFDDMCRYLVLPPKLHVLFESPPNTLSQGSIASLSQLWCSHPRIAELVTVPTLPFCLVSPRQLVKLPHDFSDLVKRASSFQCPNQVVDSEYGEEGQAAMLCLVCGEILCANSYCCRKAVEGTSEGPSHIGGFTRHTQSCGVGMGMALWILEAYVVLLDATDLNNVKGCTITPPYLDEYGEPDPGLRRGNPLKLNDESYQDLRQLWFHHRIPEKICMEMERNRGLMRITWSNM